MKKNILLFVMSFLCVMLDHVQAEEWYPEEFCCYEEDCCVDDKNFYAKIFAGANFLQHTTINGNKSRYSTGYCVAGSLGYCWCYGVRVEAEYAYRRNDIKHIRFFQEGSSKHGHFQTSSWMANLLWDMPVSLWGFECWGIQPFIGEGLGYDFQRMHSSNERIIFNQKWRHFSWQVMAGLAYSFFCNTEMTLEYKFHQGGCHINNHAVGVGLLYKFM